MRKQRTASVWANPTLVGAVTVLFALVAVFLAYSANQGLPFVPTAELKVNIADGSNLTIGNDVREGGFRVGFVSALTPIQLADGSTVAQLTLKLSKSDAAVPVDSHAEIRARSVLGLKYVDLVKGRSARLIADGGTLPIAQTAVPVQFDQIFKAFDPKTRRAIKSDLVGFGDTLAGRGGDLNATIQSLPALLQHLAPVAHYLSKPQTGLSRFFTELDRFTSALAPVSQPGARLFSEMATTFQAISSNASDYQATISKSPSTLAVSTDSLRTQQPLLADLTTFGIDLTPATVALRGALPQINPAIEAGTRTLARTPALNRQLQQVMSQLKSLAQAPGTDIAINALTGTVQTLNPTMRYLGPYVTVCNDWNYWWTYLADLVSEQTKFGTAQRALFNLANLAQPNNVNNEGSYAPVNGGGSTSLTGGNEFLHIQPYGAAIDNQGNADCETGQRGYPQKLNYFDPLSRQFATDTHTPGNQGPTFSGRAHAPAGETFSRNPQIGPQLLPNPTNP